MCALIVATSLSLPFPISKFRLAVLLVALRAPMIVSASVVALPLGCLLRVLLVLTLALSCCMVHLRLLPRCSIAF